MFRLCIIALLIMLGSTSAFGMDHAGHASHSSKGSESHVSTVSDIAEHDAAMHDSCMEESARERSMPAHGACLGCCPEDAGATDGVTTDRRVAAPAQASAGPVHAPRLDLNKGRSPSGYILRPPPQAPSVLRL